MSRKQRTTLTFSLQLPLPPGATQKQCIDYIILALHDAKPKMELTHPMSALQLNELQLKIVRRETHYL